MNENTPGTRTADVPWPTSDSRMKVPDTSMLPDNEKSATRQFDEGAAAAEQALDAAADVWRETADAWAATLRTQVRDRPLACVAAALALGVVVARISQGSSRRSRR